MNKTSFIKNIYKQNKTTERDNKLITTINQCFTNQIYKTGINNLKLPQTTLF